MAVSLVIFGHSAYYGIPVVSSINPTKSFYNLESWGAIGVDLFFTISGFIMTVIIPSYTRPGGWRFFFVKRIIRIIPLYYLLSILDVLYAVYLRHQAISFEVVIKSLIFFPLFDTSKFVWPVISVGWSLSYEMYFYTLIGMLLVFKGNIYKRLLFIILALSITGVFLNPENPLLKFLTSPLLLEFGFGIICGLLYKNLIRATYQ
jgi:exopolysaccharide production protein ExoZ